MSSAVVNAAAFTGTCSDSVVFSGPAFGKRSCLNDSNPCKGLSDFLGSIGGMIVYNDDLEINTRLRDQRFEASPK